MDSPFSKRFRFLILVSPLVFIAIALLDRALSDPPASRDHVFELFVIMLATMPHLVFTLFLTRLPEVGAMVEERFGPRERFFWAAAFAAFAIGFVTFLTGQGFLSSDANALVFARVAIEVLAFHHGIRQNFGVSMLYNARLREQSTLSEADLVTLAESEVRERFLNTGFLYSFCSFRALDIVGAFGTQPMLAKLAAQGAMIPRVLAAGFGLLLIAHVVRHSRRFGDPEKLIYFGRYALFGLALAGVFPVFMAASLLAVHAIEYFGVYDRMLSNSKAIPATKRRHVVFGVVTCLALLPLIFINHVGDTGFMSGPGALVFPLVVKWLAAVEGGLDFSHYFLDRQIFRMRQASVRLHVAPLLATRWSKHR